MFLISHYFARYGAKTMGTLDVGLHVDFPAKYPLPWVILRLTRDGSEEFVEARMYGHMSARRTGDFARVRRDDVKNLCRAVVDYIQPPTARATVVVNEGGRQCAHYYASLSEAYCEWSHARYDSQDVTIVPGYIPEWLLFDDCDDDDEIIF